MPLCIFISIQMVWHYKTLYASQKLLRFIPFKRCRRKMGLYTLKDISLTQVHKLATQVYLCLEHSFYMRGIIPTG